MNLFGAQNEGTPASGRLRKLVQPISGNRGTTLVECLMATAVLGLGLAGVMAFNSQQLRTVRSTHEVSSANLSMLERVEQMRIGSWKQLTDPTYVRTNLFATKPSSADPISQLIEELTVSAYPDASVCTPLKVRRNANGTVQTISQGTGLAAQRSAKAVLDVRWEGKDGRVRNMQSIAVLSNGGLNRLTLPAFGQVASGTTSSSGSTSTGGTTSGGTTSGGTTSGGTTSGGTTSGGTTSGGTTSGGTTTTPTPTPTPTPTTAPTPTPTPTPTTSNGNGNGNGNGRGTVGNPNGKK